MGNLWVFKKLSGRNEIHVGSTPKCDNEDQASSKHKNEGEIYTEVWYRNWRGGKHVTISKNSGDLSTEALMWAAHRSMQVTNYTPKHSSEVHSEACTSATHWSKESCWHRLATLFLHTSSSSSVNHTIPKLTEKIAVANNQTFQLVSGVNHYIIAHFPLEPDWHCLRRQSSSSCVWPSKQGNLRPRRQQTKSWHAFEMPEHGRIEYPTWAEHDHLVLEESSVSSYHC